MRCSDFLHWYTDFRDGAVANPRLQRRLLVHVSRCRRCARYHEAIDRGVRLLRSSGIEPSPRFRWNLRNRLAAALLSPDPVFAVPVRVAGSFVLAAAVTVLVIGGVTRDRAEVMPVAPPARPMPMVRANAGPPFVTFADLKAPTAFRRAASFKPDSAGWDTKTRFAFADVDRPD